MHLQSGLIDVHEWQEEAMLGWLDTEQVVMAIFVKKMELPMALNKKRRQIKLIAY